MHVQAPVTLALLVTLGAGCSGDGQGDASRHVGTYEAFGEGGNGALLEGTVQVVDGCFFVEASTGERVLVYFPEDEVEWTDGALRYADSTYRAGDSIALGGGSAAGAFRPLPSDCRGGFDDSPQWIVAQSG